MQFPEISDLSKPQPRSRDAVRLPGKPGTIPVTVRLDPPRYDRLKRLVQRLQTTGQSIIQTALDRSMVTLERDRARFCRKFSERLSLPGGGELS
jgi:hypothetical protein